MLIIRGINVFPSQIEHTIMQIPELCGQYMISVDRIGALDYMTVQVEMRPEAFSDKVDDMLKLKKHISSELRKNLNIAVETELTSPGSLPRFEGKAKRVIDRRKL
jgi:phenylacetate-CoA ligase